MKEFIKVPNTEFVAAADIYTPAAGKDLYCEKTLTYRRKQRLTLEAARQVASG